MECEISVRAIGQPNVQRHLSGMLLILLIAILRSVRRLLITANVIPVSPILSP
jgi:hypothetical protein